MNKIYKSMIRDIWHSRSRSLAIIIAIIIIISFPMALLDLSPNLGSIIKQEESDYNLAHFDVIYTAATDSRAEQKIVSVLEDMNYSGYEVQSRTYKRMKIQNPGGNLREGDWIPMDLIGYNLSDKPRVNIPYLVDGRFPQKDGEMTLLESYAERSALRIGDNLTVYGNRGNMTFNIVGLVKSVEFASFDISQVAAAYVAPVSMWIAGIDINSRPYTDTLVYFENSPDLGELRNIHTKIATALKSDSSIPSVALFWFSRETSFRQALQDSLKLTSQYMFVAALFIFAVAAIVIYVVTNRSITEQKKVLGALYAFGNSKAKILKGYMLKTTLLGIIGTILGFIVSILLLDSLVNQLGQSWGLIETPSRIYTSSLITTIIATILISYGSTILAISNISRLTPYEAMRGKSTELKSKGLLFSFINIIPVRIIRVPLLDMTRSRTRTVLTVLAFTISLTFAWSLYYAEDSLNYTVNDYYSNSTKFDIDADLGIENVIDNTLLTTIENRSYIESWEPYTNILVTFAEQPEQMTYLNLIRRNSSMLPLTDDRILQGRWFRENTSEIVISQYLAGNYGVKIGDNLSLNALSKPLEGEVVGITNDMMFTISLWMDLDYASVAVNPLNGPLGEIPFVNHMLIKLKDGTDPQTVIDDLNLNTDTRLVFTKEYYRSRMQTIVNTQAAVIFLMSTLGLIVGSVSVFSTFLIAIVEREREIALKRVFGKERFEIGGHILMEAMLLVGIALLPSFFLAKVISTQLWLGIVASTIFSAKSYYPLATDMKITLFALMTGFVSVVVSVYITTKIKLVDGIREE